MYVCYTRTKVNPSRISDLEDWKQAKASKKQQKRRNGGMRDHTLEDHISSEESGREGEEA
jgi:hypothetical protein